MIPPRAALVQHAAIRPDAVAIRDVDAGTTVTYQTFDWRTNRIANALSACGVRQHDRVAIALFNTPTFLETLYGCYKIGAVPVPMNYMLAAEDFGYLLTDMSPRVVVYDGEIGHAVIDGIELAGGVEHPIVAGDDPPNEPAENYETVVGAAAPTPPPTVDLDDRDTEYMLYTSGTTGEPKGVEFGARTARARSNEYLAQIGIHRNTVALNLSPWFHAGGTGAVIHPTVLAGGTLLASDRPSATDALDLINEHDVTYVVSAPIQLRRAIDAIEDDHDASVSSIEAWLTMGATVAAALALDANEAVTDHIYTAYGTTETLLDTLLRPEDLPEKAGTVGRPGTFTEVRVVKLRDERVAAPNERVERGERGQVITRSAAIADGYYGRPEESAAAFREGWFYTNDVGVRDEDGYLHLLGRTDDLIITGGENVAAIEVEEALEAHDAVVAVGITGEPDDKWGERIVAYVVATDVSADDLDSFLQSGVSLADFKRPRRYEFVSELPRTETGKIRRHKLGES